MSNKNARDWKRAYRDGLLYPARRVSLARPLLGQRQFMQDPIELRRSSRSSLGEQAVVSLWPAPPSGARPLTVGSTQCGALWEDELGSYCLLNDITPGPSKCSRAVQTTVVLDRIETLLDQAALGFRDVIRTWFFLDDINQWYNEFNRARTRFFAERGILVRPPASTAVGVANERHVALLAHVLAFRPHADKATVSIAHSPLQGAAFEYGPAFSRAMFVHWPEGRRLYVSGTASIDGVGRTLHPGDPPQQVAEVFRVVGALLEYQGLGFRDAQVATAYFPPIVDAAMVRDEWSQHFSLPFSHLPVEICRPDLCFEIELTAERRTP